MNLRIFVPLLAAAALAACRGDTTLPAADKLVGAWRSNQETLELNYTDGTHTVTGEVFVEFLTDGRFHREWFASDPTRSVLQQVEEGTFKVSGRSVFLHVERSYNRITWADEQTTLQPIDRTDEYTVAVSGSHMSMVYACSGLMSCLPPMFTEYQLIVPEPA